MELAAQPEGFTYLTLLRFAVTTYVWVKWHAVSWERIGTDVRLEAADLGTRTCEKEHRCYTCGCAVYMKRLHAIFVSPCSVIPIHMN